MKNSKDAKPPTGERWWARHRVHQILPQNVTAFCSGTRNFVHRLSLSNKYPSKCRKKKTASPRSERLTVKSAPKRQGPVTHTHTRPVLAPHVCRVELQCTNMNYNLHTPLFSQHQYQTWLRGLGKTSDRAFSYATDHGPCRSALPRLSSP